MKEAFPLSRPSRLGLAVVATVAITCLLLGAGADAAPGAPPPGSPECTAAVAADPGVRAAQARADRTPGDVTAARSLSRAQESTATRRCTGATPRPTPRKGPTSAGPTSGTLTPPSSTPRGPATGTPPVAPGAVAGPGRGSASPSPSPTSAGTPTAGTPTSGTRASAVAGAPGPFPTGNAAPVPGHRASRADPRLRPGDPKDCRDFDAREQAQAWFLANRKPGARDLARLDRDGNGKACEDPTEDGDDPEPLAPPEIDPAVLVLPTRDDGSRAAVTGRQIRQVPAGSVGVGNVR